MKICMVPWDLTFKDEEFFADNRYRQFILLKKLLGKEGHELALLDKLPMEDSDMVIFPDALAYNMDEYVIRCIECGKARNSIYCALEPPVVAIVNKPSMLKKWSKIFKNVITIQSDFDNFGNIRYYTDGINKTIMQKDTAGLNDSKKKLLTSISGNKSSCTKNELYSERVRAYKYFGKAIPEDFDFYGVGWDKKEFTSYLGKCSTKQEVLSKYKFALCFENMDNLNGYITEKPIDVMKAGCVPVYRGAHNITDYIDENCFVFADKFDDYPLLLKYLQNMSDEEYNAKLVSIRNFLNSEKFYRYTPEYYAEFMNSIITTGEPSDVDKIEAMKILKRCLAVREKTTLILRIKGKIKKQAKNFFSK